jgi:DNA-binding NtrC family response regulator
MMHGAEPPEGAEARCRPDAEAIAVMRSYDWPGNVRELRNVLERALILCSGSVPDAATLRAVLEPALGRSTGAAPGGEFTLRTQLDALERRLIEGALDACHGKRKDAAAMLGIDARNMGYYLRKHDLTDAPAGRRETRTP